MSSAGYGVDVRVGGRSTFSVLVDVVVGVDGGVGVRIERDQDDARVRVDQFMLEPRPYGVQY